MTGPGIVEQIRALTAELNAVILAHNYQLPEIHAVADVIGDSLELSLAARETRAEILVVCGVLFMAETAKLLNPDRTVLIPVPDAGCPLACFLTPETIREYRRKMPDAAVVVYVNSTAACKAEADIVCTSGNAARIVSSLTEDRILFGPDRNLASWVSSVVTGKEIIPMPPDGHCYVHQTYSVDDIRKARETGGVIITHPECPLEIRDLSDIVASTGKMVNVIRERPEKVWHIFTEEGMAKRLASLFPDRTFHQPGGVCTDMKKTTITDLLTCLQRRETGIIIPEGIRDAARRSVDRMLDASS